MWKNSIFTVIPDPLLVAVDQVFDFLKHKLDNVNVIKLFCREVQSSKKCSS